MPSRVFGKTRTTRPVHLARRGIGKEAAELRADVEEAFVDAESPVAAQQLVWYIDQAHGNDDNDGTTPEMALASITRLHQLWGRGPVGNAGFVTLVNILGGEYVGDIIQTYTTVGADFPFGGVCYIGERTVVYTGSATTIRQQNIATKADLRITDSALPVSFTASELVGKVLQLPGHPQPGLPGFDDFSGWAFILKDHAAKTARVSQFYGFTEFGQFAAAQDDAIEVTSLTKVHGQVILDGNDVSAGGSSVAFGNIQFTGRDVGTTFQGKEIFRGAGSPFLFSCIFGVDEARVDGDFPLVRFTAKTRRALAFGCYFHARVVSHASGETNRADGRVQPSPVIFSTCVFGDGGLVAANGGSVAIDRDCIGQGPNSFVRAESGGMVYISADASWASFDQEIGAYCGVNSTIELEETHEGVEAHLWGTGITDTGLLIAAGGTVVTETDAIDFDTPGDAVNVGGTIVADYNTPTISATNGAKIVEHGVSAPLAFPAS